MAETLGARYSTLGGIQYRVLEGTTVKVTDEGATARESYLVGVQDVARFLAGSLPPPIIFGGAVIIPPRRSMPGAPLLITEEVEAVAFQTGIPWDPLRRDPNQDGYSPLAKLNIRYKTSPYSGEDGSGPDPSDPLTFLEHSFDFGGEFLVMPPQKLSLIHI